VAGARRAKTQLKITPYLFQAGHLLQQLTEAGIQYCHCFRRFLREEVRM
jgi:hypothetical protein